MTTKSLEAKDMLTSEGWLLSETSREGSPYDLQFLINHKEYLPLFGSFCFCRWYLSSPIAECIHMWSFVLDWVMGVEVEISLFLGVVFFINSLVSLYTPWWLWSPESLLSSSTALINCMFGLTKFKWLWNSTTKTFFKQVYLSSAYHLYHHRAKWASVEM